MKAIVINKTLIITGILLLPLTSCRKDHQPCESFTETKVFNTAGTSDMSFANKYVGFISGGIEFDMGIAVIAKTIDGGVSWVKIPVYIESSPSALIRNIFAKGVDSVYATYTSRDSRFGVCFSKDGGLTWNNLGNFTVDVGYSGLYFKNSKLGFVCRAGDILQTKDGGSTWDTVFDYDGFGGIGKLFFTSDKIGYAYGGFVDDYGSFGTLVKTTDGGDTWTELTSMQKFVTCFSFVDDNTGYAFTFDNDIYKTTDGGDSWVLLNNITGQGCSYYSAIVTGKTKYFGTGWSIFKTTDDFKTIKRVYESPVYNAELSVRAVQTSENTLFFLSSQQSIIKIELNN
ncbi:MAG: hypothetical protein HXX16_09315 [Bacteroidales bacterium]|nr:hypothetical protein [Bacteroidales bacterium]